MTWSNGISVAVANYIFENLEIKIERNEEESVYIAKYQEKILLRRGTVKEVCRDICRQYLSIKEQGN